MIIESCFFLVDGFFDGEEENNDSIRVVVFNLRGANKNTL